MSHTRIMNLTDARCISKPLRRKSPTSILKTCRSCVNEIMMRLLFVANLSKLAMVL